MSKIIMRTYISLFWTILLSCIAISCEKENYGAPDKDKYIYDIPQTNISSEVITGAYYNNFSTAVNEAKSPEVPELGWYTTADAGVMEQHVEWADKAGLDFFIFTWDNTGNEAGLIDLFDAARNTKQADVKYILRYNTSHLGLSNENPLQGEVKYRQMMNDFVDILNVYLSSDSYYTIDGKPVMIMTPANLSSDALLSIDYAKVVSSLKHDLKSFFNLDLYIIGEMTTGWVAPVNYADHQVYSFDGFTLRDWKTRSYDVFFGYFSFLDINWNNWKTTLAKRNVDFVPCIYPSYNDRKNDTKSYYYTFSEDGNTDDFVNFCNVAKRNMGSNQIVLMNSWNNWNEGTNLEPSDLKEENFLNVAYQQFNVF